MTPDAVVEAVKASGLRGRGGAGFPTGMKWQFVDKKSPKPKYICCNADESEPGTFKDHVLMERNPHLLFEGCLIGCYAIGAKVAYIYIRGEFYHVQEVLEAELAKARAAGYIGKNILGHGLRLRDLRPSRRRRVRSRRRDRAHRVARGQARAAAAQAAVSRRSRASTAARRRSTTSRRSATCRSSSSTAPSGSRRSAPRRTAGRSSSASAATSSGRAPTRRRWTSRCKELIYDEKFAGGIRGGHALKCVIPGGSSVPVLLPARDRHSRQLRRRRQGRLAPRLGRHHRHGRDDVHGVGGGEPAALLQARVVRQVHAVPRRRRLAAPHSRQDRARRRADDATSTCCSRSRNNILGKTLCAFGDAAATPVLSTIKTFRAEYEAHIREGRCTVPAPWRSGAQAMARTDALVHHARAHRAARHHRRGVLRAADLGGGPRLHGAQGRGVRPAALRPVPGRPARPAAAARRHRQADLQGGAAAEGGRHDPVLPRADPLGDGGVRGVRGRAVRRRHDVLRPARPADPPGRGRRERRHARDLRDHVDGRVRHRARRLGVQQQVLAARRPALVGADDQLRAVVRPVVRGGHHAGRVAVARARSSISRRATGSGSFRSGTSSCSRSASSSS